MLRFATAIAAAVLLQAGQAAPARTITIDFVALDRAGMPVGDLKPDEVEILIGQFRAPVQRMTVVTPEADERGGRIIVVLLDDMTLRLDSMPRAREAARLFVNKMAANDQVAVLTLTGTSVETT